MLHSFNASASDGCQPYGSVARDKSGNLYGTIYACGRHNSHGVIWKVSKKADETILHNFTRRMAANRLQA
jgi:hypothetical protein